MRRRAAAVAALAVALGGNAGPVVTIDAGAVRGQAIGRGAAFRGIAYGAAPTGTRRWREAMPAPGWTGVRDATRFGPACPRAAQTAAWWARWNTANGSTALP